MIPIAKSQVLSREERALMRAVKRAVLKHVPGAQVVLYGSAARGTRGPESDYDIVILTPQKLATADEDRIMDAVHWIGIQRDAVLSVAFTSQDEWELPFTKASPYYKNVLSEGVLL